jgi:hypothetical protein
MVSILMSLDTVCLQFILTHLSYHQLKVHVNHAVEITKHTFLFYQGPPGPPGPPGPQVSHVIILYDTTNLVEQLRFQISNSYPLKSL